MSLKPISLALFAMSFALGAQAAKETKPPVLDLGAAADRIYNDDCFMSNCGSVPVDKDAAARVEEVVNRSVSAAGQNYLTFQPSYAPGISCTSILAQPDNAWIEVLNTGLRTAPPIIDTTFTAEGRIQRANGSTLTGLGAVAVRVFVQQVVAGVPQPETRIYSRWVLHSGIDNSQIEDAPPPEPGQNQPIINSASVRRFVNLTGEQYRVRVEAKWSDVFTGMIFEPSVITPAGANFISGPRGAAVCVPVLNIVENF